jgi:hypothetical protein
MQLSVGIVQGKVEGRTTNQGRQPRHWLSLAVRMVIRPPQLWQLMSQEIVPDLQWMTLNRESCPCLGQVLA